MHVGKGKQCYLNQTNKKTRKSKKKSGKKTVKKAY